MEQIKDIVAEMREYADKQERMSIYDLRDLATETLRVYADRIEAAHERELVPKWHELRDVLLKARTALACCTWEEDTDMNGVRDLLGEIDNVLSSSVPNDNNMK